MMPTNCETTGANFNLDFYLHAQAQCISAVDEIISLVSEGMNEVDGQALTKAVFKEHAVDKFWHPTKFRIGADTLKNFREPSEPGIMCKNGDVCFVDVGPIFTGPVEGAHESDFGRTFVVGPSQDGRLQELVKASESIFRQTALHWREAGKTGQELLKFAGQLAKERGFEINPDMAGHRLGDFPHKIHSSQTLFEFSKVPVPNLWVLEIHLLDAKTDRGAFFEDLLV